MHCAIVKVFPEPVTPSRTCDLSPRFSPSTSSSIARAWSPRSSKSVTRLKRSYFDAMEQKIVPQGVDRPNLGSLGGFVGGEVAGARAQARALEVLAKQPDLHGSPGAVRSRVRRQVPQRVARGELLPDLLEYAVEILRDAGEVRLAAAQAADAFELAALLHAAAPLM